MLKVELRLGEEVFYAGDELSMEISLIKEFQLKQLQLLDGSIQLIGRSIFVSDFHSFPRVQELFGDLAKVKEECKIISTEKGGTFTVPFYITKPSLLTLSEETETICWRGRLPKNLPASFIGLFCSIQHVAQVKIIWKCLETGQIGVSQSEIGFKVLHHPIAFESKIVLGILEDFTVGEEDVDDIFPDDLTVDGPAASDLLYEKVKNMNTNDSRDCEDYEDIEEIIRTIVESDCGFNRSISIEKPGNSDISTIGTIHLRKTCILPGTQIFITIDLNTISRVDVIKLKLECVESYPASIVQNGKEAGLVWRDIVRELKVFPGCQDRLEIVFPVPPELHASMSCELFGLHWELSVNFVVNQQDFDMKIPLKFISFKQLSFYANNKR